MMRSRGYEVYHYGVEGSESGADKDITILNTKEWYDLKFISYKQLHPILDNETINKKLNDKHK